MLIPRLRKWRERQGLTQVELAELAGVSARSVAGYETGDGTRPNTARKLADVLGVKVADLMEEEAHPKVLSQWEIAAYNALRLREEGRERMERILADWQESKERGENEAARREYLDEVEDLLQEAYGATVQLWDASSPGFSSEEFDEFNAARSFYEELLRMAEGAGLKVTRQRAHETTHHQVQQVPA